jgi:DNA-binding transcriptional ArsR family regulator
LALMSSGTNELVVSRLTTADGWVIFRIGLLANSESSEVWMATAIDEDRLTQAFAALANSTRRAIVLRLAEGEATVNQLAEPFQLTLPAISKHIKVLERAGLVTRGQRAQFRPCTIDAAPLEEISTWTGRCREVWEARFNQMDDYIKQLRGNESGGRIDD